MFILFFSVFSVRHKNNRQPFSGMAERIFMKLLPNDSGENGVCIAVPKWGLGPITFLGAKNYTLRTWWWRLASDSELVCWLWHCAATAVALKRQERVNAFNLVICALSNTSTTTALCPTPQSRCHTDNRRIILGYILRNLYTSNYCKESCRLYIVLTASCIDWPI